MPIHLSGNGSSHSELMSARDCLIRVKVPIILFPGALMVTSLHDSDKEEIKHVLLAEAQHWRLHSAFGWG